MKHRPGVSLLLPAAAAAAALLAAASSSDAFVVQNNFFTPTCCQRVLDTNNLKVSSGFSFSDGEQVLVSAQRPLGMVLEQEDTPGEIVVASLDPNGSAADAGVRVGDVLLAVQNASVRNASLDEVLAFIANAPRVVNLRFLRNSN
jgi:S1-C subfamily serine protease